MQKLFFILAMFGLLTAAEADLPGNLLKNGGFDEGRTFKLIPKHWGNKSYGQRVIKNPFNKDFGKSLRIGRKKTGYSIGAQIIDIAPEAGDTLVVSGYWQGENIKINNENWNGAKLQIVFCDQNEKEISQPYDVAHSTVDFDWQMFIKNVVVPQNAAKAKVLIGLWDASGEVIFDELQIYTVKTSPEIILQNGDFESWGSWEMLGKGQAEIRQPGYGNAGQALYVKNTASAWTFGVQMAPVSAARKYRLTGLVKCNAVVPGKQIWQKGRVYVEYLNEQLEVIGELEALRYFEGSSGWRNFEAGFTTPQNAKFAKLYFGLQDSTGEIAFDNLVLR